MSENQKPDEQEIDLPAIEMTWKSLTGTEEFGQTIREGDNEFELSTVLNVRLREVVSQGETRSGEKPEYELMDQIGEGGMGLVFSARQNAIDRVVALKRTKTDNPKARNAFLAEAAVLGNLEHPNIVPIHDVGRDSQGELFYAMKNVKGTPWSRVMADRGRAENIDILLRVCDAVAFAHSRGIIHRDIKPENVMLGDFGEVYVMDWGLAAAVSPEGKAQALTEETACAGTPGYMAPEMGRGDAPSIGIGSDVYLLGAVLFEIITGKMPHTGSNIYACLHNVIHNVIEDVPHEGELMNIARRAMHAMSAKRFDDVQGFQQAIRDYENHYESNRLTDDAVRLLNEAEDDYEKYSNAVFAFREALKIWDGNRRAAEALSRANLAYARSAFKRGDLELASSMIDLDDPDHEQLDNLVQKALQERDDQQRRLSQYQSDLKVAGQAQTNVQSLKNTRIEPFDLDILYRTGGEVGSSYHDAISLDKKRVMLIAAAADEGGLGASLDMVALRTLCRMIVGQEMCDPVRVLREVNRNFNDYPGKRSQSVSIAVCLLEANEEAQYTLAAAGDMRLLLWHSGSGELKELEPSEIGLSHQSRKLFNKAIKSQSGPLSSGDTLLIASAGLYKAKNAEGEALGRDFLRDYLTAHGREPLGSFMNALTQEVDRFRKGTELGTDVLVAGIKNAGMPHFGTPDGREWQARGGTWHLSAADDIVGWSSGDGYLVCLQEHPDDFRLTATMRAEKGRHLSVWFAGTPENVEFDGYFVGLRRRNADLQRLAKPIAVREDYRHSGTNAQTIEVERKDGHIIVKVDNRQSPVFEIEDPEPLRGEGHRTWGFYTWSGRMIITAWKMEAL